MTIEHLPTTTAEFIKELNKHCEGWEFTGNNPFKHVEKNYRIQNVLRNMAVTIFGDDDLVELEELWEQCGGSTDTQPKLMVDFELLKNTFACMPIFDANNLIPQEMKENLSLFFDCMSNPAFAHKFSVWLRDNK